MKLITGIRYNIYYNIYYNFIYNIIAFLRNLPYHTKQSLVYRNLPHYHC